MNSILSAATIAAGAPCEAPTPIGPRALARRPFAHIVSVSGGQAIAAFDAREPLAPSDTLERVAIGAIITIATCRATVIGVVTGLTIPTPDYEDGDKVMRLVELDLVGEIAGDTDEAARSFRRGVRTLPTLGDAVSFASHEDLSLVYSAQGRPSIALGSLYQDAEISARVLIDDLLSKHFAVVGTTGSGKSCGVAALLHALIASCPEARVVVLDVHNEYGAAFRGQAEIVNPSTLYLPFWLLSFDELAHVFFGCETPQAEDLEILHEAVMSAKKRSSQSTLLRRAVEGGGLVSADTPTPFRLADITNYLDEQLGRLEKTRSVISLRRLKARIDVLTSDPRYSFMFGKLTVQDNLAEIIGQLFRIPTNDKPMTILELSAIPSEVLNVLVAVICRLAFDLGTSAKGQLPILLICEEAHRYAPLDHRAGFGPTRQALARIAKEGRKYAISLGVVTQRPSELDATLLSQCSTIFAHRLSNEADQKTVRTRSADCASGLLEFLSSLGDGEALAVGQGVSMPMRISFTRLAADQLPSCSGASFSHMWKAGRAGGVDLNEIVARWRFNRGEEARQAG